MKYKQTKQGEKHFEKFQTFSIGPETLRLRNFWKLFLSRLFGRREAPTCWKVSREVLRKAFNVKKRARPARNCRSISKRVKKHSGLLLGRTLSIRRKDIGGPGAGQDVTFNLFDERSAYVWTGTFFKFSMPISSESLAHFACGANEDRVNFSCS